MNDKIFASRWKEIKDKCCLKAKAQVWETRRGIFVSYLTTAVGIVKKCRQSVFMFPFQWLSRNFQDDKLLVFMKWFLPLWHLEYTAPQQPDDGNIRKIKTRKFFMKFTCKFQINIQWHGILSSVMRPCRFQQAENGIFMQYSHLTSLLPSSSALIYEWNFCKS